MQVSASRPSASHGGIAGSGNLILQQLQAKSAEFDIAGSGNIRAAGRVREAKLEVAGSGNGDLDGLQRETAEVSIAGSGNAGSTRPAPPASPSWARATSRSPAAPAAASTKMGSGDVRCG